MVSRRIFFSICIMMAAILFMFQFLMVIREVQNDYDVNDHMSETALSKSAAWTPNRSGNGVNSALGENAALESVVYIGNREKAQAKIVSQWGEYTKRRVISYNSLSDYAENRQEDPVLICVAGSEILTNEQVSILNTLVDEGHHIVLCDIPSVSTIRRLESLSDLMGIQRIMSESIQLTGIKLFSGFLLGGEAIYQAKTEKEQKMQDMNLSTPWYLTQRSTKTYMVGLLDDEAIKNEELPGLIWRRSFSNTQLFVINGSYMSDQTGIGILDAIMYELQPYEIHPMINAQNLSVVNYPNFALENTAELNRIYARDMQRLQMDLLWPNLISSANKGGYKMTCLLTPQLDYTSDQKINGGDLVFYLKQFNEQNAEAGISLDYLPGISLKEKIQKDRKFYDNSGSQYQFGSAYINTADKSVLKDRETSKLLSSVRTVTGEHEDADALISYYTNTIVDQGITANGFTHTYLQDLKLRSIETALGYSNILLDMKKVSWPEDDQYWEVLYEAFASNINTYWNAFSAFDKTTLSESDERIRSFLAMDYSDVRDGDLITLNISNRTGDVWFLLRTHSESVSDITGGTYKELEKHTYLICAQSDVLKIKVEADAQLKYTLK